MKALCVTAGMVFLLVLSGVPGVQASDLAIYSGPSNPGWIGGAAVRAAADVVMNDPGVQGIFESIEDFGDGDEEGYDSALGKWLENHTGNGEQDVIFLPSGTCPSALYQFPNADPDGSNVELFLEDGNVLINIADWIFYMSYEGGVRSADNGAAGAANIFDIPGLTFAERVGAMEPTAAGEKYIPSLEPFNSNRPWHVEQFGGTDWEVTAFAQADDDNADPAVAVNTEYGAIIAAMWQSALPAWPGDDPRGIGVVEFITNWLTEHGSLSLPVEAQGKASITWAEIKRDTGR